MKLFEFRPKKKMEVAQPVDELAEARKIEPAQFDRVVAERSGREVFDRREALKHDLRTTIYFYANHRVIGAPLMGRKGEIHAELLRPFVANEPLGNEELGKLAFDALLAFEARVPPSLRDWKKRDWPAFRVSGAKSTRQFEAESLGISIETINTTMRVEAFPLMTNEPNLALRAYCSPSALHEEFGSLLRLLLRGVDALRSSGVV